MSTRVSILSAIPFYSFPLLLLSLIIPSRSLVSEFNPPLYSYTASNPSRKFSSFTFLSLREKSSCYQDYCLRLRYWYTRKIDGSGRSVRIITRGNFGISARNQRRHVGSLVVGEVVASRHSAVCFQRDTRLPFDARRRLPHSPPICRLSAQGKPLERENLSWQPILTVSR